MPMVVKGGTTHPEALRQMLLRLAEEIAAAPNEEKVTVTKCHLLETNTKSNKSNMNLRFSHIRNGLTF